MSRALDYPALLREATIGLVREVLARTAADGLPGDHHFFLTFRTTEPGVEIPPNLLAQYPETLTIVLQNQFWDLEVGDDAFEVTLRFGGDYDRLRVSWSALTAFLDPSVPFGLDFTQFAVAQALDAEEEGGAPSDVATPADTPTDVDTPPGLPAPPAAVLPFRRRDP